MCYNCFQRMKEVPPLYSRIATGIEVCTKHILLHERLLRDLAGARVVASSIDVNQDEILSLLANSHLDALSRLAGRKRKLQAWYDHVFPLSDLLAPTTDGTSPR